MGEAYAEAIPGARLVVEDEGKSPIAWQGGQLSKVIAGWRPRPRCEAMSEPVFLRDGERFVPTGHGRGPWDAGALHGGAPQPSWRR